MKYLIPVTKQRHHFVVSHILASDLVSALCVAAQNRQVWPRVSEGDWTIADAPIDVVCLRCVRKNRKTEAPPTPKSPKKNNRHERELKKLADWKRRSAR